MNEIREETISKIIEGANFSQIHIEIVSKSFEENGWIVHPVYFNGKIVGGIIEKNGSIHTSIDPKYQKKWNPRPYIKSILYPALVKYGILFSDALKDDHRAIAWLVKIGFCVVSEDSDRIYFELKNLRINYMRESKEKLFASDEQIQ